MGYTLFMLKYVGDTSNLVLLCQYRDIACLDTEFYLGLFNKILNVMKAGYESTLEDIVAMLEKDDYDFHKCYTYSADFSEYTFSDFDKLLGILDHLQDNLDPDNHVSYYMTFNDGSNYVNRRHNTHKTYYVNTVSIDLGSGTKINSIRDLVNIVYPDDEDDDDECDSVS